MSIVIGVLTFILVLTSLFLVMIVLMQRAKTDGGIGAAMAGGATESAFGAEQAAAIEATIESLRELPSRKDDPADS